jgi:hypothetical protein
MNSLTKPLAVVLIGSLAALAGCNKRETPAEVNADVANAQTEKAQDVNEAMADRAEVAADTAKDAASTDPDDRGDAIEDRAEAAYNVAIAKIDGDLKIAKQACDGMAAAMQKDCNVKAEAAHDVAKSAAKVQLDAEKARSNAVQKLDNK